ncbi:MAG TPA: biotin/lipoyl-containing protein [Thermoanaerobaculia bacterium]|nr:biotin/lipoyl-containing protein [Thermoanaerobaculia bacterium]
MRLIARHEGREIEVEVERHGPDYRVRLGDRWIVADLVNCGRFIRSLRLEDGTQFSIIHHRDGNQHSITLPDAVFQVELIDPLALKRRHAEDEHGGGGLIKALMPGRIVRILVNAGDSVQKGTGLLILEAMKMENEIQATIEGVVDKIFVTAGQTVDGGADLVHIG